MAQGRFSKLENQQPPGAPNPALLGPPPGAVAREAPAPPPAAPQAPGPNTGAGDNSLYPTAIQEAEEAFFTGQHREALRHFSRALQLDNAQVYPWIGQVSALLELRQYREAEIWSQRALEQFPEEPSLLSQRARVLAATGNLKRAIGVSDYAMSRGATPWAWLARGEVLLHARDGNALHCFEKAIELAGPQDWRVPMLAGLCYLRVRQWSTADDFLQRALENNPRNHYLWYEHARALLELSHIDRARDAIERAKALRPDFKPLRDLELMLYRRPFFKRLLGVFRR
jgi:tetratricopeptide (TPR) repeat protein